MIGEKVKEFDMKKWRYFGMRMVSGFMIMSLVLWPFDDLINAPETRWNTAVAVQSLWVSAPSSPLTASIRPFSTYWSPPPLPWCSFFFSFCSLSSFRWFLCFQRSLYCFPNPCSRWYCRFPLMNFAVFWQSTFPKVLLLRVVVWGQLDCIRLNWGFHFASDLQCIHKCIWHRIWHWIRFHFTAVLQDFVTCFRFQFVDQWAPTVMSISERGLTMGFSEKSHHNKVRMDNSLRYPNWTKRNRVPSSW